jgi:hypothetical protein
MTNEIINYYDKYIKYKIKYINLKNEIEIKILDTKQQGGNIKKGYSKFILDDNINNKYPNLDKEYNVFGHMHSKLNNCGCFF